MDTVRYFLVESKANFNIKNKFGQAPRDVAKNFETRKVFDEWAQESMPTIDNS